MDFEVFIGRNGKKYWVFENIKNKVRVLYLVSRTAKRKSEEFKVIPVWVEGANMYDSKTAGAKKKWAVVRG